MKITPSRFNPILSQILKGLLKTEAYFDNIIVHNRTLEECKENLPAFLKRLTDFNLHFLKCSVMEYKISKSHAKSVLSKIYNIHPTQLSFTGS